MLTKISSLEAIHLASDNIKKIKNFDVIHDNMNGYLLIKYKNKSYLLNYYNNKIYLYNRIQVHFNGITISKQIDSFDQNNYLIANNLRLYVLSLCNLSAWSRIEKTCFSYSHYMLLKQNYNKDMKQSEISDDNYRVQRSNYTLEALNNKINTILGIGGEYYLYFPFIQANNYIGISNHQCIIDDAQYNNHYSKNYLVNYDNIFTYPQIDRAEIIILNVYNIHTNIIKYIKSIKFDKLIIISCNLPDKKLLLLKNNFTIQKIKYFHNFDNLIRIINILANKN